MPRKKRVRDNECTGYAFDLSDHHLRCILPSTTSQMESGSGRGRKTGRFSSVRLAALEIDAASHASSSTASAVILNDNGNCSLDRGIDALGMHEVNIGQASYQRKRRARALRPTYVDFGDMTNVCVDCDALFWLPESKHVPRDARPIYTGCCQEGRIRLPSVKPTPDFLEYLLDPNNGIECVNFRKNIRGYNTMFAFTSIGANVDTTVNDGHGPYVFKISGQIYHLMGSLVPPQGECPKFAQLYIHDTENEVVNRQRVIDGLDPDVISKLIDMFDGNNELVQYYRSIRAKYDDDSLRSFNLTIIDSEVASDRQYDVPSSSEVAGLIVGDIGLYEPERDIVVEGIDSGLQRVSRLHPKFMSFQYPVLFPYGEDGYHLGLQLSPGKDNVVRKRTKLSMRAFISYQIHERANESITLLKGGRLFQQFLVDAYANVEEDRLFYIRQNQRDIRSETYEGICDASLRGDNNGENVGKRVILPSTHTGSPRYMIKHYHDAMALCRKYGPPDLFITFTCNSKWPEIERALQNKHGKKTEDRPDVVARIFKMKHDDLIEYVKSGKPFGKIIADVATIEFQKRGLPHSHMLFWLAENNKCYSGADIDSIISAEIPDKELDPILYNIVNQFMIHGPCGVLNRKSPCMRSNKCKKSFPKDYTEMTLFETNKLPVYRRRDDPSKFVMKNDVCVDNGFVVPYNAELLLRYNAHINVESCCQSMLIKYLFKYISKGPDRARVGFQSDLSDEIAMYLNCRYISAPEAAWRLFEYPIHSRHPPVELLKIHLPGQQRIVFGQNQPLASVISREGSKDTMLTAWFRANVAKKTKDVANRLTYAEFPSQFVWDNDAKCWNPRQRGYVLGRLANVHPTSGELYYLRLLLNTRKGCKSFESVRTICGVVYSTYQEACRALGLLGDDKEWSNALTEAVPTATSSQLRHLFVTIIMHCDVSNPRRLFQTYWRHMCDDILYNVRSEFMMQHLDIPESELHNALLFELELLLSNVGSSLAKYHLPLPDKEKMIQLRNKQLRKELDYDCVALEKEHLSLVSELNDGHRLIYETVIDVVYNKSEGLFLCMAMEELGKHICGTPSLVDLDLKKKLSWQLLHQALHHCYCLMEELLILDLKYQLI
uniref:uncharacterized protein LOC101313170 isoform X1 n=1 Tax=Fragaria vesca subsp. vesca TaxID=101020 RepID=UPI0005C8A3B7|nr:PREDICTED: uncharacterized protein LOC101313170 isoform X1 [Fragaria vesca subsp. vesca]